jgi:hypothetical protein
MPKKKQETLLPERKARSENWKPILALQGDERHEAAMQLTRDMESHPDYQAAARIEKCLQDAHVHQDLAASPELQKLVFIFREIVADFVPGETVGQALEPLLTLLSQRGGGRPPATEINAKWLEEYEAKERGNRTKKPSREIYEDMAANENGRRSTAGLKPIKWTRIRDGIGAARKAAKNPV